MYSIENYKDYTVYALNGISLHGFERNHLQIHLYASIQMYFYMLTLTTRLYIPIHPIYSNYNNYTFHSSAIAKTWMFHIRQKQSKESIVLQKILKKNH
jgi:hypothetical protein